MFVHLHLPQLERGSASHRFGGPPEPRSLLSLRRLGGGQLLSSTSLLPCTPLQPPHLSRTCCPPRHPPSTPDIQPQPHVCDGHPACFPSGSGARASLTRLAGSFPLGSSPPPLKQNQGAQRARAKQPLICVGGEGVVRTKRETFHSLLRWQEETNPRHPTPFPPCHHFLQVEGSSC